MRKSRDQRIADIRTTVSKYEAAGLGQDRSVGFLNDMCYRLERGKSLTTKQRSWADKLCSSELPKIKNEERVKEIQSIAYEHQVDDFLAGILYCSKYDGD